MTGIAPNSETTVAIILGASSFPFAPQFEPAPQFRNSATKFQRYLLAKNGFGLPKNNLLSLFNTKKEQSVVVKLISEFLSERQRQLATLGTPLSDVIFYYVGHGGFDVVGTSAYFLALRQTRSVDYLSSSLSVSSLRRALKEYTRDARHYLILDCCFAASALVPYLNQSATSQAMVAQVREAFPSSGTAFLCAAGATIPARVKREAECTMFSDALLTVLNGGLKNAEQFLSLAQLGEAVRSHLNTQHGDEAARPEVHSPEQSRGSVAEVPLFPNPKRLPHTSSQNTITAAELKSNQDNAEVRSVRVPSPSVVRRSAPRPNPNTDVFRSSYFVARTAEEPPPHIPLYWPVTKRGWKSIPFSIQRSILKVAEHHQFQWRVYSISLLCAVIGLSLHVFLMTFKVLPQLPSALKTTLAVIWLITFFYGLISMCFFSISYLRASRDKDPIGSVTSVLRPLGPGAEPWERLRIVRILRRPDPYTLYGSEWASIRQLRVRFVVSFAIAFALITWLFVLSARPMPP